MEYPTIRLVFDAKKQATKTKKGLVQVLMTYHRVRRYISTGVKVYSDQWDNRRMVVNSSEANKLNQRITKAVREIEEWLDNLDKQGQTFEFPKLDRFLNTKKMSSPDFIKYLRERIEERGDLRESTKISQRKLIRSLEEFGKIRYFDDLNKQTIVAYDEWLHTKGYAQTTVHGYHKWLKCYINDAMRRDLLESNPYALVKISRGKSAKIKYLTTEELSILENAPMPTPGLEKVRDLFVFQCYTGLAYSDLVKFDFSKVEDRAGKWVIKDVRVKSSEQYYIVLLTPARQMLEKYGYKLPVITNQQYNLRLKAVAGIAGLSCNLTSHMGRHTFAVMCLSNGAKIQNISKMLGHTNIVTTQIYAKVLNSDVERDFDMIERKIMSK